MISREDIKKHAGKPSREVAKALGVSKTTINCYRKLYKDIEEQYKFTVEPNVGYKFEQKLNGNITATSKPTTKPQTMADALELLKSKGVDITNYDITYGVSEWESAVKGGGSQTLHAFKIKATPKRNKIKEIKLEDLDKIIGNFQYKPSKKATQTETLVLCPADLQIGKVAYGQGTESTIERVMHSINEAKMFAKEFRPNEIVLPELGDIIENFNNVTSQKQTNDNDLVTQIRIARRLMIQMVTELAPLAPKLVYCSVPSNHAAVRDGSHSAGNTHNDFGIEINHMLKDVMQQNPSMQHVKFEIPALDYESMTYHTNGTGLGMVHGHQTGNVNNISKYWQAQSHGKQPLETADILLVGHWHSLRIMHSGNARYAIIVPSSDPGSPWFTGRAGERAAQGMLMFTTTNGSFENFRIV